MKENTAQELMFRSLKPWEGYNFLNSYLNWTNEKSIDIYTKNKCHWNSQLEPEQ